MEIFGIELEKLNQVHFEIFEMLLGFEIPVEHMPYVAETFVCRIKREIIDKHLTIKGDEE